MDFKLACQVVNLLCESMGIRAIARITGLNQETVLNILETAGQKAAQFLDSSVHDVHADFVAADEIHTFVYSKEMNTDGRHKDRGEQYTFFAIDRRSKLILSWLVGKRTAWNAEDFLADVKKRVANRFQLNTDNWNGYGCTVQDVFGNEIDHAVETKYFAKPNACYQSGQAKQLQEHLFAIKHDHENLSPHNLGCHYITFFDRAARNGKLDSGN